MKQILVTFMMLLIVGAGTAYAQDKKADTKQPVKTEAVKTLDAKDAKACAPGCEKACCAKSAAHGGKDAAAKKGCKPGCSKDKAKCASHKSSANGGKDADAKACSADCKKACCAKQKTDHGRADKDM